ELKPGDGCSAERRWRLLWELAGVVGVDPGGLTLRELFWMAEGRDRNAWNHTAQLLAMIYNAHRAKTARVMKPSQFHPLGHDKETPVPKTKDLSILKEVFVDR
ncbi:MAG TPA: hypothetical protein DD670_18050, partial [Planctomycetaceae bacterium]|nr:hypothetical protein [Planctomycetaceae bacterium]